MIQVMILMRREEPSKDGFIFIFIQDLHVYEYLASTTYATNAIQ
jgi:hypothetical protein